MTLILIKPCLKAAITDMLNAMVTLPSSALNKSLGNTQEKIESLNNEHKKRAAALKKNIAAVPVEAKDLLARKIK